MAARGDASETSDTPPGKETAFKFKLVLVGSSTVGKTSLVLRFVEKRFSANHQYTIGATFSTQTVIVGSTAVKIHIWDTAGQERFQSMMPMYYRGAHAAVVVYDITNKETFHAAKTWVEELRKYASPNIIIALAGNKVDLQEQRAVQLTTAQQYAEENGLLLMETSAKTAMNVDDIFTAIARKLSNSDSGYEQRGNSLKPFVFGHKESGRSSGSCCGN